MDNDVEMGNVEGDGTVNGAVDQDSEQADNGLGKSQNINGGNSLDILREASGRRRSNSGNVCRASIDSLHGISWTGLGNSSPAQLGVDSNLGSLGNGIRPVAKSCTIAQHVNTKDTILAREGDPGAWAVRHHKENFIQNIREKPPSNSILLGHWNRRPDHKSRRKASRGWKRVDDEKDFRISLAELQRMRLRKIQGQLVKHVAHMKLTDAESENWEGDLETYIKAVQDYDYMISRCKLPRDPFLVTGERSIDSYVLHSLLGDAKKDVSGDPIIIDGPWEDTTVPIGGTRNLVTARSEIVQFRQRLVIAAIAGSFLIAPMWLMVLHNTLYTCLVSTTVFVIVFGVVLAAFLDGPKEVMSGTAAYAAVLVVFVGLGNT
ncbi:hypothetical protein F4777DRAFT_598744 [Nemania sp. FL0916]|nr:hypothetical protein F4777DRAFT_598744 [Nemania sp. FL0916]